MSQWNRVPFSDLLIESRDGEWGEGQQTFGHQLCEIVRGTDFANLNESKIELPLRWIPDHLVKRKQLAIGDILFEMAGGTAKQSTGRSALLTATFFENHTKYPILCASFCRHLRLDRKQYEPAFIYFLMQALYTAGYMAVFNIQHTGVSRFQYTSFKKQAVLEIPLLRTQKKIAGLLSTYDKLIENNQRRIALLEKMAEEIYREWFVRLRFPGHEKVKVVKGVPEGWQVLPFSEVVGINPSERLDRSEEVPFVGMEDLSLNSMFFNVKEHRKGPSGSKFRNWDVLFPRITPSVENGKRGVVMTLADGQVGCGSTEFIVMREKVIGMAHIYFVTCCPEFRKHAELSMTGASGRQRVKEDCFSFFLVKTPTIGVRLQFSEVVNPHFLQIRLLSLQNENLMKSRDALLPRLISGKLSVENLDIQFPPGMEEAA